MIELQPIYGIEEANRWATAEAAINPEESSCFDEAIQTLISPSASSFHLAFPNCTTATYPSPDGLDARYSLSPNRPRPGNSSFTIPSSLSRSNPAFYDYTHSCFRSWDTDSDGVTDFDEFQNSSNPLLLDTDSDKIPDFREDAGNLTMTSGGDPEIVDKIEAFFTYHWKGITIEKITITVTVHVRDDAGLDYAKAKCEGAGGWKYNSLAETETVEIITKDHLIINDNVKRVFKDVPVKEAVTVFEGYNADFTGAFLTGYDIEIEVGDVNGYGVKGSSHLDSIAEGVIKAIISALERFVKMVTELLASMFNWIWNFMKGLMDRVLKPITDSIAHWQNSFIKTIYNGFKGKSFHTSVAEFIDGFSTVFDALSIPILLFGILYSILFAINTALKVATAGLGAVLEEAVKPFLGKMVLVVFSMGLLIGAGLFGVGITISNGETPANAMNELLAGFKGLKFIVDLFDAAAAGFIYYKIREIPAFILAMLSFLFGSIGSLLEGNWYNGIPILVIFDLLALSFAAWSIYDHFYGAIEVPMSILAGIVYLIEEVATIVSLISALIAITANGLTGKYNKEIEVTPPFIP